MFLPNILDTKVIDEEAKLDGAPIMFPQAWGGSSLKIAFFVEAIAQEVVSQLTTLG